MDSYGFVTDGKHAPNYRMPRRKATQNHGQVGVEVGREERRGCRGGSDVGGGFIETDTAGAATLPGGSSSAGAAAT